MIQFYFKSIYRNARKFKTTFLINVIGLSTGLAGTLLIFLWISDELSVDKFHKNRERLYKVMVNDDLPNGINTSTGTSDILGETLKAEMPEIELTVTTTPPAWFQKFTLAHENTIVNASGNFASSDYFKAFSFDLYEGDSDYVLADKSSIAISETLAQKLFGTNSNVTGKTIEWSWQTQKKSAIVSGIFKDAPSNSTQRFDFILPFQAWNEIIPKNVDVGGGPFETFVVLKEDTSPEIFNEKFSPFIRNKIPQSKSSLRLANFSDDYLHGNYSNGKQSGGRIEYVQLFSIIAIFILVIACINFMNLSTAKEAQRMKEVGIKKTFGAGRGTLIIQYLGESLFTSYTSLLVAVFLVYLLLPQFNAITGKNLQLTLNNNLILSAFLITTMTGLIAGSYPAFYLSRFNPVNALRGRISNSFSEAWVRKGLVAFQFTVSVIFIASVLIVYNQIGFVMSKNLGYKKENVIYFETEDKAATNLETFLQELAKVNGVIRASSIQQNILLPDMNPHPGVNWDGKNQDQRIRFQKMPVNYDIIETLGIEMKEGRSFSRDFKSDSSAVILNEAAIEAMEITDPIGKIILLYGKPVQIVGVTKNFHFNSLHQKVKPFLFYIEPPSTGLVMLRIEPGKERETIKNIKDFYSTFNPGFLLDYRFLDTDYQKQYASDERVAKLSPFFAGLAVIISCLGLFGLAAFTVERRTKEIGIRKVLGISEAGIVYLLTSSFTKIVLTSIIVGIPISYFITHSWLDTFAYRIELSAWYFVGTAIATLFIAWLTVGFQTARAAMINPIITLKQQ